MEVKLRDRSCRRFYWLQSNKKASGHVIKSAFVRPMWNPWIGIRRHPLVEWSAHLVMAAWLTHWSWNLSPLVGIGQYSYRPIWYLASFGHPLQALTAQAAKHRVLSLHLHHCHHRVEVWIATASLDDAIDLVWEHGVCSCLLTSTFNAWCLWGRRFPMAFQQIEAAKGGCQGKMSELNATWI